MPHLTGLTSPTALAHALSGVPGVVEHGLFIGLAHMAIIGGPDGVKIIERPLNSRARWSFKMRVVQSIKSTVRPAGAVPLRWLRLALLARRPSSHRTAAVADRQGNSERHRRHGSIQSA